MSKSFKLALLELLLAGCSPPEHPANLVPGAHSQAPDYFCTWNIQGFCPPCGTELKKKEQKKKKNIITIAHLKKSLFLCKDFQAIERGILINVKRFATLFLTEIWKISIKAQE